MPQIMTYIVDVNGPLSLVITSDLMQKDRQANTIKVLLQDRRDPVDLTGWSALYTMEREDGVRVVVEGQILENEISVTLTDACYQVAGRYAAFIRITSPDTEEKRTVLRMAGLVVNEGNGPVIDGSGIIPSLEDLLAQIAAMEEATEAANKAAERAENAAGNIEISPEAIQAAVNAYLEENPVESVSPEEIAEAVDAALQEAKDSGEFDGKPGVSATHKWSGTTLTITSASGTSSADLKGDPGYTPIRGTDYWTDADKAEIVEEVKESGVLMTDDLLQETDYTIAPYTNIIDRYGTAARSVLKRNGSVGSATYNVWVANFFPVRKGQKIHIKFKDGASFTDNIMFALYDENKTFHDDYNIAYYLNAIVANPTVYGTLTINGSYAVWDTSTIGYGGWANFAYARIMYTSTDCVITVDEEITDTVETVYELRPTVKVPKGNLDFDVAEKPLVGKTVVGFGDSLFGQVRDETSALYQVAQITGAEVINVGFGGTSAARVGSGAFSYFSLPALTDAIISGTWTNQDSNSNASAGWVEQLPTLKSINFSTVDIIILHYGTNDYMSAHPLEGSGVTSVCGGLRYSIDKLLTKYPQIKVYISLPVYRYWGDEGAYVYPDTYTNGNGAKLTDYIEGIRKVAAEYNFPVIDGYHGMGVNRLNAAHYLKDQTHHNIAGMSLFGEYIAAQLTSQQASAKSGMDTEAVNDLIAAAIGSAIGGSY